MSEKCTNIGRRVYSSGWFAIVISNYDYDLISLFLLSLPENTFYLNIFQTTYVWLLVKIDFFSIWKSFLIFLDFIIVFFLQNSSIWGRHYGRWLINKLLLNSFSLIMFILILPENLHLTLIWSAHRTLFRRHEFNCRNCFWNKFLIFFFHFTRTFPICE